MKQKLSKKNIDEIISIVSEDSDWNCDWYLMEAGRQQLYRMLSRLIEDQDKVNINDFEAIIKKSLIKAGHRIKGRLLQSIIDAASVNILNMLEDIRYDREQAKIAQERLEKYNKEKELREQKANKLTLDKALFMDSLSDKQKKQFKSLYGNLT